MLRFLAGRRALVTLATAAVLAVLATLAAGQARRPRSRSAGTAVGPASTPAPVQAPACRGTRLRPGDDLQAALAHQPEGDSFCFSSGIYRLDAPLVRKARQRLVAEPRAVLRGTRPLTGWTRLARVPW